MLLGTLEANLLENLLTGPGIYRTQWNCIQNANFIKYGLIKEVNFTIILLKNG